FLGGPEVASMTDLRGRRLAVHAAHTAPGCFARIVLPQHCLDPDVDVTCVARDPGDYQMDLRRLRDGSLDAAYVGSTLSPEHVSRGARSHPSRALGKRAFTCWPGSAITSRSRPLVLPSTPSTSRWTAPRCRRWCAPTNGSSALWPSNASWQSTTSPGS